MKERGRGWTLGCMLMAELFAISTVPPESASSLDGEAPENKGTVDTMMKCGRGLVGGGE